MRSSHLSALLCCLPLWGQSPLGTVQHLYNAYWTTGEFHSVVHLHNNLVKDALVVTPHLFLSNGNEMSLAAVSLPPLGNATVDLKNSLVVAGLAGSADFQYVRPQGGALSAEIYCENVAKSLSFTIPSATVSISSQRQDAVFWLPSSKSEVYAAFQNTSDAVVHVTPTVRLGPGLVSLPTVTLSPHGAASVDIGPGTIPGWSPNAVGSIAVEDDGPSGALNTGGWLESDDLGYSTTLTFADPSRRDTLLMTTQVLVGAADAVVGFPLTVSSKLLIGNLTDRSAPVTGQVTFSDNAGHVMPVPLQAPPLGPNEVRAIDLNWLKANAGVPLAYPSASLSLDTSANPGAVMARVYGMSADGQMGFYWALQNYAGRAYDESYWSTEGAWTTVVAIANFAGTADTVKVTVTSNVDNIDLPPFQLQPGESRTLNLSDLARGSNFPRADSGGLRITGQSPASRLLVKEHLVNHALELATPFYGSAPFVYSVTFYDSSYVANIGGDTVGVSSYRYWSNGIQDDGCAYGYSSDNTSIATIYKNGCVGVMTAVAAGTTNIRLYESDPYDGAGDYGEFDAAAQATAVPQCFAQLKYRPVDFVGVTVGNHSFWWIQDSGSRQWVTDAGPSGTCPFSCGYLIDWVVQGSIGHYPEDNSGASLQWTSGLSPSVCTPVTSLYNFATGWPQTTYSYAVGASPNSNSFAHWAGNAAPFAASQPPNTPGW